MKIFITGQKRFGAAVLNLCLELGHEITGVSSPRFIGHSERLDNLRVAADLAEVPWRQAGGLKADTLPDGTELIIAAHSHDFIGRKTRLRAALGAIGYHPSLLPLHRGRDAIRWALKMGDRITGGSVFWLSENVDGGDIAAQDWCFIQPGDTARELWRRELLPMGLRLLAKVLVDLEQGIIVRVPQDETLATWEPSWEREPLRRPDLELLGAGLEGYEVRRELTALHT